MNACAKQLAKSFCVACAELKVNWTGLQLEGWQEVLQAGGGSAVQALLHKQGLPKRLSEAICQELHIVNTPAAQLKKVCDSVTASHSMCCASCLHTLSQVA